jgi:hypothetical protein
MIAVRIRPPPFENECFLDGGGLVKSFELTFVHLECPKGAD